MRSLPISSVGIAFVLLVACSGGGGSTVDNGICRAIADNGATVETDLAPNASITQASNVFDGNLESPATLTTTGGAGSSSVQGTLGSGSEPGGVPAGILYQGNIASNTEVVITTFLNGTTQESGPAVHTISRDSLNFLGINTTEDFDSIEATFNLAGEAPTLKLYELCVGVI